MKPCLLILLLLGISHALFAQTNPYQDEKAKYERYRKFNTLHRIKQVNQYLVVNEKDKPSDSTLFCSIRYDKNGNVTKMIRQSPTDVSTIELQMLDTQTYVYDKHNNLIKETLTLGTRSVIKKVITNARSEPEAKEETTYQYDDKDRLIKDVYFTGRPSSFNRRNLGNTQMYIYDVHGDVKQRQSYIVNEKAGEISEYFYNDKQQLIKIAVSGQDHYKPSRYDEYSYNKTDSGLLIIQNSYNEKGDLLYRVECLYVTGNRVKEYQTFNGKRKLVWNGIYNHLDQLLESIGESLKEKFIAAEDIRQDGSFLSRNHLFYTYNKEGLLVEIKKYKIEPDDHKENLANIEKLVYIKY